MTFSDSLTRRKKVVLITILGLLAVLVGFLAWFEWYAAHRWSAMCERALPLMAEATARDPSRPVLRGEPLPGNAWDEYEFAVSEAKAFTPAERDDLLAFIDRTPKANTLAVELLLTRHAAVLDHLRQGARRTNARRPHTLETNPEGAVRMPLLPCHWVANLAVTQARLLQEDGRHREAADLMLDTCIFGHDVGLDSLLISTMIGLGAADTALKELRDIILSGRLDKDDLLEIERELEILDRSLPSLGLSYVNGAIAFQAAHAELGPTLERINSGKNAPPSLLDRVEPFFSGKPSQKRNHQGFTQWDAWRYGFSLRLMIADALELEEAAARAAEQCEGLSWPSEQSVWEAIRLKVSKHPFLADNYGKWIPGRVLRAHRARLRLLRIAAHFLATGQFLELDDPFGAKMLHTDGRIWSVGPDGTDNSGQGDWDSYRSADIVLEIDR